MKQLAVFLIDRATKTFVRLVENRETVQNVLNEMKRKSYDLRVTPISKDDLQMLESNECGIAFV